MRILFEFELFQDMRTNASLIDLFLAFKAGIIEHFKEFEGEANNSEGAIIVIIKPSGIGLNIMGFEKDLQDKIAEKYKSFDMAKIIREISKRGKN